MCGCFFVLRIGRPPRSTQTDTPVPDKKRFRYVQHVREYVSQSVPDAIERFTNEINRLYGVLDIQLTGRNYIANEYSIADIACWTWCRLWRHHSQKLEEFPNVSHWLDRIGERPAVQKGFRLEIGRAHV